MNPRCVLCVGDAVGVCLECDQPVCGIHEALAEHDCASACGTWQERVDNITRQRDEARAERDQEHRAAFALSAEIERQRMRAETAEAERDRLRAALQAMDGWIRETGHDSDHPWRLSIARALAGSAPAPAPDYWKEAAKRWLAGDCTCGGGVMVGGVRALDDFSGPRVMHLPGCPAAPRDNNEGKK